METIRIETDREAAECIELGFSSTELRGLCSNLSVSRERGDSKMQTAERIVDQMPAVAAAILENDAEVNMDASAFRQRREVGADELSLEEAIRRSRSEKMRHRLERLEHELAVLPSYEASVNWEYGAETTENGYELGVTSVTASPADGWDAGYMAGANVQAIFRPTGRATALQVRPRMRSPTDYAEEHSGERRKAWRLFCGRLERLYEPED